MSAQTKRRQPGPSSAGRCRSCGAAVDWLPHATTGRLAPIEVARTGQPGNIAVNEDGAYYLVPPGEGDLVSHFANCPAATTHHKEHA